MNQRANDLEKLVELMKEKLMVSNKRERKTNFNPDTRILVLTAKEFKVSKATARKAIEY